jgi:hypothetical protein
MPLRIAVCACLFVVLSALPAAAQAADTVRPSSVTRSVTVPGGSARNFTLECPSPGVALSGAASRRDAGLTLRRSTPGSGPGDWHFRLAADADRVIHRATLVLRCVRLGPPTAVLGTRLDVKTTKRPGITIGAGEAVAARALCGRAWLATGYGLQGGSRSLRLDSVEPLAHGWDFTLVNTASRPIRVGVSSRCLKQTVSSQRGELRFQASRPSRHNAFGPGRVHSLGHSCGSGLFSLATGSTLDPAATFELAASGPVRTTRGRWTFRNGSGGVTTHLICLSRASRFR